MGQVCSKLPAPWQHPAGMWEKNGLNGDICSVLLISLLQPGRVKRITCSPPCLPPAVRLPPSPEVNKAAGGGGEGKGGGSEGGDLIALPYRQITTGKGGSYIVRGTVNISILGSLKSNRRSSAFRRRLWCTLSA